MPTSLNLTIDVEKRRKTEKILANIYSLPAIPEIMFETSRLLDDPSTSTAALARLIGKDQGLASRILSIANSALYGLPRKVSTIDFALLVIGYKDTKNIVVALSLMEAFKNKSDVNLNYKNVWIHSYMVGGTARKIATDNGMRNSGEAFVGGLLHDLGIPVIHKYLHSMFLNIINSVNNEGLRFLEAEAFHLGLTHQDVGGFLGEKWNLPPALCEVIQFHHDPVSAVINPELTAVVHLADYAVNMLEEGKITWDKDIELDEEVMKKYGFTTPEQLGSFIKGYKPVLDEEIQLIKY
ncbi:MAG: HDOD domain-containing protein [Ignavibacteriales bacterium]|nr:HDOD domain-containing protein [Ignavibacteriales bacterium]